MTGGYFFQRKNDLCILLKKILKDSALMKTLKTIPYLSACTCRFYFVNSEIIPVTTNVAWRWMSMTRKSWHLVFQKCLLHAGWILITPSLAASSPNTYTHTYFITPNTSKLLCPNPGSQSYTSPRETALKTR